MNLQQKYDEVDDCFGKLFDITEPRCQVCASKEDCEQWRINAGDPDETKRKLAEAKKRRKKRKAKKVKARTKKAGVKLKDDYGYKRKSRSSRYFALVLEGGHTAEEIVKITTKEFRCDHATNEQTFKLFIFCVQKPVGKYAASRGLKIIKSEKGALSFEQNPEKGE